MSSNVMTERRTLCPSIVVTIIGQLWPTIEHLKVLNQTITLDKLQAHMYKKYRMTSSDCHKLVTNALKDNLLVTTDGTDKNGQQITIYMIPENREDGHDWYCYECHKPGSVVECFHCWRVFHSYCIKQSLSSSDQSFDCSVCRQSKREEERKIGSKVVEFTELNQLLGYVYNRLTANKGMTELNINSDDPNIRQLLYSRMDLSQILSKTKKNLYKKLIEFQTDIENVVHCMLLLDGTNETIISLTAQLITDCIKELNELRECIDCYRMSNQKQDKNWFCKPCDPPHQLVFAKQKGWPYWPAKVIKRNPITKEYDVLFFGTYHERSTIDEKNIKPIDTTLQQLRITKQSPLLTQALRELRLYQNNLLPVLSPDTNITRSPIRAASGKRPRKRADGSRPRKRSKTEIKSETIDQQNESSSDSVVHNTTDPSFLSTPNPPTPKKWKSSTPKPFVKTYSPIKTRNRGMKTPFQTKTTEIETKRSPKKERRSLQKVNSPVKTRKMSNPRLKKNNSEVVSNESSVKPKKSVNNNNKRNKKVMNGLSDDFQNEGSNTDNEEIINVTRIKSSESAQTSSLARSRPVRQIKPNSRFKSPEIEVKIPKRKLRNERIVVKKELNEQSVLSTQTNGETEYIFTDDSNSANNTVINNTKTKSKTKGKRLNAIKSEIKFDSTRIATASPSPSTPLRSFGAMSPVPNGPMSPTQSPVVSPKSRGRPKGVKNKSTLEKIKLESMKTSPQKRVQTLAKELTFTSSGDCNCKQRFEKIIKKFKENLETQHKEETKQLKRDLESVKQLNYRLQNENKSLKSESQGRDELNALKQKHLAEISEIKKKQWCYNCGKEAIYFCCWNTSYCSQECQQQHWHKGHKKSCRRANTKR